MLTYTVHKQHKKDSDSIALYVPEKFSWPAAWVAPLWILYHRLWGWLIGYILFLFILNEFVELEILTTFEAVVVYAGFSLLFGYSSYDAYRLSLMAKGFKLVDIIIASSEDEAELKYISYHVKQYDS